MKTKFSKLKIVATSMLIASSQAFAGLGNNMGIAGKDDNILKKIIDESPVVSVTLQAGILFGILYAIFGIGKELLSDGQGGGKMWGKLGAIVAFAVLYYFLFMGTGVANT